MEADKLTWLPIKIRLGAIRKWSENPRFSTRAQAERLIASEKELGQPQTLAVSPFDKDGIADLYDGHQRCMAWMTVKGEDFEVWALQANRYLIDDERRKAVILLHAGTVGNWDWDLLSGWDTAMLKGAGMDADLLKGLQTDAHALATMLEADKPVGDAEIDPSRAGEFLEKWQVRMGDLYAIGSHRLLCGDSTKREDVERVMGGEKAVLCHADPPYGMGKEKDGVENDNLHAERLDAFQMAWWKACRPSLTDNASVYIWGVADDLWRLWYMGGLRDSERMVMRNEIVWAKGAARAMGAEIRSYPPETERALFIMLGEQGFNINADNYWKGWENIRSYLYDEIEKLKKASGMTLDDIGALFGVTGRMIGHFISKSQWEFLPENYYKGLQEKAREYDGFEREYDELKREFYATRAYFDNLHQDMTDIWRFQSVLGEERWEHATPKPVDLVMRAIKSSSPDNTVVFIPFAGSGSDFVGCQNLGRKAHGLELRPDFSACILERMSAAFPGIDIRRIDA